MRRFFYIAAFTFASAFFVLSPLSASAQNSEKDYIEVVGTAKKEVAPDRIYLEITINEKDYKNKPLSEVEKSMAGQLTSLGIDIKENLTIKDMASNFKYYFLKGNDARLMKEYQLKVADAVTAGKVIAALKNIGISQVSLERVENSKIEEYKEEVRAMAIKNAKEKAKNLTQAIGQSIGKAIYIYSEDNNYRPYQNNFRVAYSVKSDTVEAEETGIPDIQFENLELEASVRVRFELK